MKDKERNDYGTAEEPFLSYSPRQPEKTPSKSPNERSGVSAVGMIINLLGDPAHSFRWRSGRHSNSSS